MTSLTGLPNRALFQDRVERALGWSRREGTSLAVLYLDLDRFKEVNDTLGHAAGDRLLIGRRRPGCARCVRETDTLARLGGDEFAVLQVGTRQLADTEMLAQRLIDALEQEVRIWTATRSLSASASALPCGTRPNSVVSNADAGPAAGG